MKTIKRIGLCVVLLCALCSVRGQEKKPLKIKTYTPIQWAKNVERDADSFISPKLNLLESFGLLCTPEDITIKDEDAEKPRAVVNVRKSYFTNGREWPTIYRINLRGWGIIRKAQKATKAKAKMHFYNCFLDGARQGMTATGEEGMFFYFDCSYEYRKK